MVETEHLSQLGHTTPIPASPAEAVLESVPNPHPDTLYLVRFVCPEFTALCPLTGQPDFAHLVLDYAPEGRLVESKSLKLYLASFRNHGAFARGLHARYRAAGGARDRTPLAAYRRLLVSARRHPDRRLLPERPAARGPVGAGAGRWPLPRPRLSHGRRRRRSGTARSRSASMRSASPRPRRVPRHGPGSAISWPRAGTATWAGWPPPPLAARARGRCGRRRARSWCSGSTTARPRTRWPIWPGPSAPPSRSTPAAATITTS